MRNIGTAMLAGVVAVVIGSAAAHASVTVANRTDKSVWWTLYGAFGQTVDSGCLRSGADYAMTQGRLYDGGQGHFAYLRGELKANANCGGTTLSDTGRGPTILVGAHTVKTFSRVSGKIHVG